MSGSLPVSAPPPALGAASWSQVGFFIYRRRSDPNENTSLEMQAEQVVDRLEATLGFPLADQYHRIYEEELSGGDADVRLTFNEDGPGLGLSRMRPAFEQLLRDLAAWSKRTRGIPVICCFTLNRLGRSKTTAYLIDTLSTQTQERLRVWRSTQPEQWLNPAALNDKLAIWAEVELAGKQELETKRAFVSGAKLSLARNDATRSLSERQVGYRRYPCDRSGAELTDFGVVPDHYRLRVDPAQAAIAHEAFEAVLEGLRPTRVAARLQARYGNHPLTRRPWTKQVVLWLLTNPLYKGTRRYNRRSALTAGSTQRLRNAAAAWVHSPSCESLRIVSDTMWDAVQRQLAAWGYGPKAERTPDAEDPVGRRPTLEFYFYRTSLLRCGLCGGALSLVRHGGAASSATEARYRYRCQALTRRGLPTCQSHPAAAVDADVNTLMAGFFENVTSYKRTLEATHGARADRFRALQARLADADRRLQQAQAKVLQQVTESATPLSPAMLQALDEGLNRQLAERDALKAQVDQWGSEEQAAQDTSLLALLDGVQAFTQAPISRRRQLLKKLLEAVYIWPDGHAYFQWRGMSTAEAAEEIRARLGRELGAGNQWQPVDSTQLEAQLRRVFEELPQEWFLDLVSNATLYTWLRQRRLPQLLTLLRLTQRVRDRYVNLPALQEAVRAWVREQVDEQGASWYRLERLSGVNRITARRVYHGEPVAPASYLKMAERLGLLAAHRALPEWFTVPPQLDELLAALGYGATGEAGGSQDEIACPATSTSYWRKPESRITYSSMSLRTWMPCFVGPRSPSWSAPTTS